MSRRRIVFSSLVCFGLLACLALPTPRALTPEEENFGEAPEPITVWPLPAAELAYMAANYLEFDSTFTISVYWNPADTIYSSPADWPWPFYDPDPQAANGTMEEFIQAVMPPALAQDDMYDESAMRRTFYYFGHDRYFDNDQQPWVPYYPTHVKWIVNGEWGYITHFNIAIMPPGGGSWQENETVHIALPYGPISLERMAFDGFAHEWKHLIQGSIGWALGYHLGADYTPSEFFAQCAEYLSGWFWLNPTDASTRDELPFTRGLFSGDYYQACEQQQYPADTTVTGHPQVLKHMTYSMFAPYLMDHYSLGTGYANKAMFRWIHSKEDPQQAGELPARGDLKGLSLCLGDYRYDSFFSAPAPQGNGDARVREMFQEFALSLWVNDPGVMGEASVWANGASPSGTHGYMVDFDGNCTNDVHTLPLYNVVTGTHKSQTDWVTLADLYPDSPSCAGSPPYPRRALQVSTYGYNVLPFVAAPGIQNEALAYDLRVDVSVDDSYWCDLSDEDVDAELTNNDVLHFYVLGYPEATSALHEAGSEAELINTYEFSNFDNYPTPTFSFSVGRFGVRYKSVVLIMTLTENELDDGPRTAKVLPFDYSYWAEGHTAPITADTFWPGAGLIHDGIVSLNGEVTVEAGAKLTISAGTQVFCADRAAVPGGEVGFDVQGALQIGSLGGDLVQVEPVQGTWTGINVDWGYFSAYSSSISGFAEISAGIGAGCVLNDCDFQLAPNGAGYAFAGAEQAVIQDCEFTGTGVLSLGMEAAAHSLETSTFSPPPGGARCTELLLEDDASIDSVLLDGGGIRCTGGTIGLASVEATAPELAIPLILTGVAISGDAEVLAEDCKVTGFDYAISLEDASTLTLHGSYLSDMHIGVILNTTQAVDLGHDGDTPDSPYWGNNCFEMAAGSTCRTSKLSRGGCTAERNYWGAETPLDSLFCGGGVDYQPYQTECPLGPGGGGQFNFGVVQGSATTTEGLRLSVYPNPGNPSFTIGAFLPTIGGAFSLAVYDVAGRLVRELAAGKADGREHQVHWDGTDQLGHPAGSGVYFAKVRVGASAAATQKLILVR